MLLNRKMMLSVTCGAQRLHLLLQALELVAVGLAW